MKMMILTSCLLLTGLINAQEPPSYSGEWNNRKARTTGNLAVMAIPTSDNSWKAMFIGEFLGDRFEYEVLFTSEKMPEKKGKKKKKGKDKLKLRGKANIDGELYTWTGTMTEKSFSGRYSSSSANGDFRLARNKTKK